MSSRPSLPLPAGHALEAIGQRLDRLAAVDQPRQPFADARGQGLAIGCLLRPAHFMVAE